MMTNAQMAWLRCNVGRVLYDTPLRPLHNDRLFIYRALNADPEDSPLWVAHFTFCKDDNDKWDIVYFGPMKPVEAL